MLAWLSMTPLGRPVEPLVYRIAANSWASATEGARYRSDDAAAAKLKDAVEGFAKSFS